MLGVDRPFYLMETYRWEDLAAPPPLPQIAAEYIALMKQIQPRGPYLIGGFCNGATIVYEMARQLHADGEDVPVLVAIDAWSPGYHRGFCRAIQSIAHLIHASRAWQLTTFLRVRHLFKWFHASRHHRQIDRANWVSIDQRLQVLWPSSEALRKDYVGVFMWLSALYAPGFYPGKVSMLWNKEDPFYRKLWFHLNKWRDQAVTSEIVEGDHITIRTDFLQGLAMRIRAILTRNQATHFGTGKKQQTSLEGSQHASA
jgi:thioesterase domain-containing protein